MAMVECPHGNIPGYCAICENDTMREKVDAHLKRDYIKALSDVRAANLAGPRQTMPYRAMTLAHIKALDTFNRKKRALWEHLCSLHDIPPGD